MGRAIGIVPLLATAVVATAIAGGAAGAQAEAVGHEALAGELAAGRAVLRDLEFAAGSHRLEPSSRPRLKRLARAINATSGTYLIEAHVDDTGDAARDHALSERRELEVKALLILEGVPPERLVAVGYGAARPGSPPRGGAHPRGDARIEVARAH